MNELIEYEINKIYKVFEENRYDNIQKLTDIEARLIQAKALYDFKIMIACQKILEELHNKS